MTIIELLNKKANGEETPEKFKYDGLIFEENGFGEYEDEDEDNFTKSINWDYSNLNDEIEIIEDLPDMRIEDYPKKIEKLDMILLNQSDNWLRDTKKDRFIQELDLNPYVIDVIRENTLEVQHKINEIIDYINKGSDK